MKEYLEVYHDPYFLHERIKEIDQNYNLMLNKRTKRFEVHNFCERGTSLVTVLDKVDASILNKLKLTRIENYSRFLKELETANIKAENEKFTEIFEKTSLVCGEIAKYSFLKNRDLTDYEFKKILNI